MKFGLFYELQLPKPWDEGSEQQLYLEALEQIELADRVGIDHAWAVEHHFLEEYSHCSAPEVFLANAAARTSRIRLGHGIRQVISNYNHPARTAEVISTLDLVSGGRVDFGIGEGATRMELAGFGVPAREKRDMSLEAAEQIANMMAMTPYPGYSSPSFELPCRNVIPKPLQKPHPPMWMACTNRDTIRVAASHGLGVLAFSFVDPRDARSWCDAYYDTIAGDHCVPLGHSVNPNLAMVTGFSVHPDRATAVERGKEHFEFFGFALNSLVASDTVPGRTRLWERYQEHRASQLKTGVEAGPGIGTPDDLRQQLRDFEQAGVDQVIFMQQCGRARHEHICESIERFATEVLPEFAEREQQGAAARAERLAPSVEAALARKKKMPEPEDDEIPVVRASVKRAQVNN